MIAEWKRVKPTAATCKRTTLLPVCERTKLLFTVGPGWWVRPGGASYLMAASPWAHTPDPFARIGSGMAWLPLATDILHAAGGSP